MVGISSSSRMEIQLNNNKTEWIRIESNKRQNANGPVQQRHQQHQP